MIRTILIALPFLIHHPAHAGSIDLSTHLNACVTGAIPQSPGASLMRTIVVAAPAVDAAGQPTVKNTFNTHTSRTCNSVQYRIPEQTLKPGEALEFAIPEDMRSRPVNFVVLGHRQDPSNGTHPTHGSEWDSKPGLTSVQVYSNQFPSDPWRYWGGSASGDQGAKFAEVSHSPELENLYEWRKYGHSGTKTGSSTHAPLLPRKVRLVSTGQDPVVVSELTVKVEPVPASQFLEGIFAEGTKFPDPQTGTGTHFAGGQAAQGKFPRAVVLSPGYASTRKTELPSGWKLQGSELRIPLKASMKITQVEVAGGDSHEDGITNSDGGWGTKGWAKLSIGVRKTDGQVQWMMNRENVPPEGILMASPVECNQALQAGDEIVIRSDSDTTYLMGVRIGLAN